MIIPVSLTLPGLINNINTKVHVGVGTQLFDISYILGVSPTSSVLLDLSWYSKSAGCAVHPSVDSLFHAFKHFPRP
jgi:hypothetical protein